MTSTMSSACRQGLDRWVGPEDPVPTLTSYINGREIHSESYVYTVSTRAVLDDAFTALTLKRRLERGELPPEAGRGQVVGRCGVADEATVQEALSAAAQASGEWASTPLERRMQLGSGIRRRLLEGHRELAEVLIAEGTPRALAEWQIAGLFETFSPQTLEFCAGMMRQEFTVGPRRLIVRRVPDGVVCVNPPQNAPAASALFGVTALMAGNPVIVRAPRSAPFGVMFALREYVVPALEEMGAPPGVLGMFCARPGPVMRAWLAAPEVADIFYTGGVERGLGVQRDCVEAGKKPVLELAGNDCVIIWKDADLDRAVEALTECFFGSGQICMVPNQVLVHPEIADSLLERLSTAAGRIRPGYAEDPGALLSPVLRAERFFAYIRDALGKGARLVHGARRLEVDGSPSDTGLFIEPTVLRVDGLESCRDIDAVREETFFPLLPVLVPEPASDEALLETMIRYVNGNPYGLRNSLWTRDDALAETVLSRLVNGGLIKVNDSHIGFLPYLPSHGGTGLTGGVFGEANYMMLRTSHLQGVSIASGVRPSDAVFAAYNAAVSEKPVDTGT